MSKYRSHFRIVADILSVVNEGARKTHIMYKTNLNHKILCQYLNEISNAGLICLSDNGYYEVTDKGRSFLRHYVSFLKHVRQLEKRIHYVEDTKEKLEKLCLLNPEE